MKPLGSPALADLPLPPPFAERGDAPRLTQHPGWFNPVSQGK